MAEALEGFIRWPRSIEWANGPTKCGGYLLGLHSLRPCPRNGASWRAGVGRVRRLAFLSILLSLNLSLDLLQASIDQILHQ
jgi:hypothetical protein